MKNRVVYRHVGFHLVDDDALLVCRALRSLLNRRRNKHASRFFIVAQIFLHFFVRSVSRALAQHADLQEMVRIEIDETHISILPDYFYLVRERSVDVLGPEILDGAPLCFPIDKRPVDLGVLAKRFNIVGGHSFWIFAPKKW